MRHSLVVLRHLQRTSVKHRVYMYMRSPSLRQHKYVRSTPSTGSTLPSFKSQARLRLALANIGHFEMLSVCRKGKRKKKSLQSLEYKSQPSPLLVHQEIHSLSSTARTSRIHHSTCSPSSGISLLCFPSRRDIDRRAYSVFSAYALPSSLRYRSK